MSLRSITDTVTAKLFNLKLIHAWVLAIVAIAYIAWAAPLALQSLVLVLAKVWIGALIGYAIDRAVFDGIMSEYRRAWLIGACVLAVALGV